MAKKKEKTTKHTPNSVKVLSFKELNGLARFMDGTGKTYFQGFAERAIKSIKENFVQRKPSATNMDYHQWGYYQGLLDAHKIYAELADLLELEKRRRDELEASTVDSEDKNQ